MLLNMPTLKNSTKQQTLFNLFVHNRFCKEITTEEICRLMQSYTGTGSVTLHLNVFGRKIQKEVSLKSLQENMDNFFSKNVLHKVFLKFEYADAVANYQFLFVHGSTDIYFSQDLIFF